MTDRRALLYAALACRRVKTPAPAVAMVHAGSIPEPRKLYETIIYDTRRGRATGAPGERVYSDFYATIAQARSGHVYAVTLVECEQLWGLNPAEAELPPPAP